MKPGKSKMKINLLGLTLTRSKNINPSLRFNEYIRNSLKASDLIIDAGANQGQFIELVLRMGFRKEILAFEPTSEACEILKSKYENYSQIKIYQNALGSRQKTLNINVASNKAESSSFYEFTEWHKKGAPDIQMKSQEKVKQLTLSSILKTIPNSSIFIKIDVQGYELEVLNGINKIDWNRVNVLLIEVNLVETYKNSALIEEIILFMRKKNFRPFRIEPGFGLPNFGQQLQADIIFVKN
jgi:FkbM family methyltransferase